MRNLRPTRGSLMKILYRCVFALVSVLSVACLAQQPTPVIAGLASASDLSANFVLPVKDLGLSHYGMGGELSASHLLTSHVAVQVEGDYLRTDYLVFRDRGVRAGGVLRFRRNAGIQPYARALVGYSWVQDTSLPPANSYHGSPSLLGGAGLDFRLAGCWYGRAGVDVQYDWITKAKVGRGVVGISYHFDSFRGR
jgi:hypothetical protein